MAMLACIHFVSWVVPVDGGKHRCNYCRETVTKKQVYPKFEDLGAAYQQAWDAHEGPSAAAAPAPAPAHGAPAAAAAKPVPAPAAPPAAPAASAPGER